ncbi:hypothetical protein ACNKHS_06970 [Shigella flexneri]
MKFTKNGFIPLSAPFSDRRRPIWREGRRSWKFHSGVHRGEFLGESPDWYKLMITVFLVVNPVIFCWIPFIAGWPVCCRVYLYPVMAPEWCPPLPVGCWRRKP